ncbi:MAG: SOS response-associated peptidase family protein [Pseudomonadota bacterium]
MCVNYLPPTQEQFERFDVQPPDMEIWPTEIWQDYAAPIIRTNREGRREAIVATFGMVPKNRIPADVKKYSTMNARAESVGSLRSYSKAWKTSQLCLVPMQYFYEPNWETGKHIRWRIAMQDESPFAVAGLWREWPEENGQVSYSFAQLTVNADDHEVMKHFHRPGEEKRSLVIIPASEYDDWLNCRNPEVARTYMSLYPAELMASAPAPKTAGKRGTATEIL